MVIGVTSRSVKWKAGKKRVMWSGIFLLYWFSRVATQAESSRISSSVSFSCGMIRVVSSTWHAFAEAATEVWMKFFTI